MPWTASITNISSSISALLVAELVNFDDDLEKGDATSRANEATLGAGVVLLLAS